MNLRLLPSFFLAFVLAASCSFSTLAAQTHEESEFSSNLWPGWNLEEEEGERRRRNRSISHEGFGLRLGFFGHGLFDTEEGAPFRFFDVGMRYKVGEYYFDLRAPVLALIVDGAWVLFKDFVLYQYDELWVERLNNFNILNYWELAHAKMGYRFRSAPSEFWGEPRDISIGIFGTAELLFLETRRGLERDDDYFRYGYDDPLIVGAGGFLAIGDTTPSFQYDVSLNLGVAVRGESVGMERQVYMAGLDADFQYEIGYGAALYLRPRVNTYLTRITPMVHLTWGLSTGVNIRF